MINPLEFLKYLNNKKINFFTGVPDSLLKNFLYNLEHLNKKKHITAISEGSAIAIGSGYFLSSKKIPCVYFQNSGLGNAINPLTSITHNKVYSIPMVLLIGWRGEPGVNDEPQHKVKGAITRHLLKLLNIKYVILSGKTKLSRLNKLISHARKKSEPVAILVSKDTFKKPKKKKIKEKTNKIFLRKDVIEIILDKISNNTKIISTTGYTSRELFQIRKKRGTRKGKDFYMVGGMGHAASLSLGVGMISKKKVICLDGDGSLLMHLGSLSTVAYTNNKEFIHILLNNSAHESVGGQKVPSEKIDYKKLSISLGYKKYFSFDSKNQFNKKLSDILKKKGPIFVEIKISQGALTNLARPKELLKIKKNFTS